MVRISSDGELLFTGSPSELIRTMGGAHLEPSFVAFLAERGH